MDNDDCTHFKWTLSVNMASYVRYRYIYRLMDRYQDLIMLHKTVYKTGKQKLYLVEEELQLFVCQVNACLLKTVPLKMFKPKNV